MLAGHRVGEEDHMDAEITVADAVTATSMTPPTIVTPGDLVVSATGPDGAHVSFSVFATDDVDGATAVSCSPASGSLFAIGTSAVTCTATDAAGNVAAASFCVQVRGVSEQLDDLETVLRLDPGAGAGLGPRIDAARSAVASGRAKSACAILGAFDREVVARTGTSISPYSAGKLLARTARIRAVLAC